jgi:hypothetical protein
MTNEKFQILKVYAQFSFGFLTFELHLTLIHFSFITSCEFWNLVFILSFKNCPV